MSRYANQDASEGLLSDEQFEELFLGLYGDIENESLDCVSKEQVDVCNYYYEGIYTLDGVEYYFRAHDGNIGGSVLTYFSEKSPPPRQRVAYIARFYPRDPTTPVANQVYPLWRKESWFQDKERGLNYDRHFAPGGATEKYYRDWACSKGLEIISVKLGSDEDPDSPEFKMPEVITSAQMEDFARQYAAMGEAGSI